MEGPAGYAWLIERFRLRCARPHHSSSIERAARQSTVEAGGRYVHDRFPMSYDPGEGPVEHLEFALKYDGVELALLARVFEVLDVTLLREAIARTPTGKYMRRLWFLYEWLTGQMLELPDLSPVAYVELLDPERYFTSTGVLSRRHRVRNNLLGSRAWCPMLRKTPRLAEFAAMRLAERLRAYRSSLDPALLRRAINYLYTKETRASFAIEREEVDGNREARFVALLQSGPRAGRLGDALLIELQNTIVEDAYREDGYRRDQNYISETTPTWEQRVHYVCPRPEHVPSMMAGLFDFVERCISALDAPDEQIDPIVAAAAVAFSFVYIHPFDDGNGRIHRYLIHFMLHRTGFCPPDLVLPVSAAILRESQTAASAYDAVLEDVSRPILRLVHYRLDPEGHMVATGNDATLYQFLDLTPHAEALYVWVKNTIERDLVDEVAFIRRFDEARRRMSVIVDMPDKKRDLMIKLCASNNYALSRNKRQKFAELTDLQVAALVRAIAAAFQDEPEEEDDAGG